MAPTVSGPVCPPFDPQQESITEFIERFRIFNREALTKAGNNEQRKAEIFIKCLPVNVITDLQRRMKPTKLSDVTYEEVLTKITAQFQIKKSLVGAAVQFLNRKQQVSETIEAFAKVINDLAAASEYSDCCRDRLLRDTFISGLQSSAIMKALLPKADNLNFNECVEKAKFLEQLSNDAEDMHAATSYKVNSQPRNYKANGPAVPTNYTCIRCSTTGKHFANVCPYSNLVCRQCKKKGHIARACRTSKFSAHSLHNEFSQRNLGNVKATTTEIEGSPQLQGHDIQVPESIQHFSTENRQSCSQEHCNDFLF